MQDLRVWRRRGAAAGECYKRFKHLRLWGEERLITQDRLGDKALSRLGEMWGWRQLEWRRVTLRSWLHRLHLSLSNVSISLFRQGSWALVYLFSSCVFLMYERVTWYFSCSPSVLGIAKSPRRGPAGPARQLWNSSSISLFWEGHTEEGKTGQRKRQLFSLVWPQLDLTHSFCHMGDALPPASRLCLRRVMELEGSHPHLVCRLGEQQLAEAALRDPNSDKSLHKHGSNVIHMWKINGS